MWGHTGAHRYPCVHCECDCPSACPCESVLRWREGDQARRVGPHVHMDTPLRFPQDLSPWFLLFPFIYRSCECVHGRGGAQDLDSKADLPFPYSHRAS